MAKTSKQVISGYHRPVCVKCNCELHPETNGVGVLDVLENMDPYQIWDADLWKCPKCGIEVVGGFGGGPISSHLEPHFQAVIDEYVSRSLLIKNNG